MEPGGVWIVDAYGCAPERLRSPEALEGIFQRLVRDLGLYPLREPLWHSFAGAGGVTGFLLLQESHLACHTFPERGFAAFDLYCCRPRPEWPWAEQLSELLGAARVEIRRLPRGAQA